MLNDVLDRNEQEMFEKIEELKREYLMRVQPFLRRLSTIQNCRMASRIIYVDGRPERHVEIKPGKPVEQCPCCGREFEPKPPERVSARALRQSREWPGWLRG